MKTFGSSSFPGVIGGGERPRRKKTGGRQKGTPNKRTQARRELINAVKASGTDPLTFFADILRNENNPLELRIEAASALLPYMHPKLASIEARTGGVTREDWLAEYYELLDEERPNDEEGEGLSKKNGLGALRPPSANALTLSSDLSFAATAIERQVPTPSGRNRDREDDAVAQESRRGVCGVAC